VSKFMPWPKDFESCSSLKNLGQHCLLKATSLAVVTPFYSVSLIESVQSEIASERPVRFLYLFRFFFFNNNFFLGNF